MLADGFALHLSDRAATSSHTMVTLKLLVPLGSRLRIEAAGWERSTTRAILAKPGIAHAVACDGPVLALMIPVHRAVGLARRSNEPIEQLSSRDSEVLAHMASAGIERLSSLEVATGLTAELIEHLARDGPSLDSRVLRVLRVLDQLDGPTPPLDELAAAVGLSRFRLAHLFSAEVGVPIRRYAMWRRLARAAAELGQGRSQAAAALAAGFADQAHLCRTSRALVGRPASALSQRIRVTVETR